MPTPAEILDRLIGEWFDAGAVIEILGNAGYVIVPKEPTREMWAAGGDAIVNHPSMHHDRIIGDVWPAMIAAATRA